MPQAKIVLAKRTLVGLLGVVAAAGLLTTVPADESGRRVKATVAANGAIDLQHISGPEHRTAYRDLVGIWTICDGDTAGVKRGMVEAREGCTRRLESQLLAHAEPVMACVPTLRDPGRDHQRWAMVSLAYNAGATAICRSTAAKRFRADDWAGGCDALLAWDKAGRPPRAIRGLTLRRRREREICLTGLLPGRTPANLTARIQGVR